MFKLKYEYYFLQKQFFAIFVNEIFRYAIKVFNSNTHGK